VLAIYGNINLITPRIASCYCHISVFYRQKHESKRNVKLCLNLTTSIPYSVRPGMWMLDITSKRFTVQWLSCLTIRFVRSERISPYEFSVSWRPAAGYFGWTIPHPFLSRAIFISSRQEGPKFNSKAFYKKRIILNLGTRLRHVIRFMLRPLYRLVKSHRYTLTRRLGEAQDLCGVVSNRHPSPCNESNPSNWSLSLCCCLPHG
jgi:hypothetical protein